MGTFKTIEIFNKYTELCNDLQEYKKAIFNQCTDLRLTLQPKDIEHDEKIIENCSKPTKSLYRDYKLARDLLIYYRDCIWIEKLQAYKFLNLSTTQQQILLKDFSIKYDKNIELAKQLESIETQLNQCEWLSSFNNRVVNMEVANV